MSAEATGRSGPREGRDGPRAWPLKPPAIRAVLSGHGILGLAFAAVIYLVCLTGTLAVFAHDIAHWEQPDAPQPGTLAPAALDRAIAVAAAGGPKDATLFITMPVPAEPDASIISFTEAAHREWAIARDGALVERRTPIAEFLVDLHVALHLPRAWGGFIVGLTGVALLSSLVSGILAHPRIFKDAFHLRLGGSRRLQEADLHNRLGIWALPFHVVMALTGALLGLSTLIVGVLAMLLYRGDTEQVFGLFAGTPPPVNAAATPLAPLEPMLAAARARGDGAEPRQVMVERTGRADARVTINSQRSRLLVAQDTTVFDARGRVVSDQHPADMVAGTKMLGGIGQLHFGWFGGVPVRLLYGLLGLALCVVTSSGVTVWLARRRDRGRAVPQWERLWTAVVWGQPLALALTALAGLAAPAMAEALVWVWLAVTVATLLAAGLATRFDARGSSPPVRAGVAAAIAAVPLVYLLVRPMSVSVAAIEIALVIAAVLIAWRGVLRRRLG